MPRVGAFRGRTEVFMMRHLRHAVAFAFGAWWLAACAGLTAMPGGESVVEGQVRILSGEFSRSGAAAIEVAVRDTSVATSVGADGRFVLDGVPAGDVELVFRGPWGESGVRLEAVARGQTVRVAVALGAGWASLEAVSRSSDALVLDVLPDRWQLSWLQNDSDDTVVAMITGDEDALGQLDHDCFQLVGDRDDAAPLVPSDILVEAGSVALRFAGADVMALLDAPFVGSQHDAEVSFCLQPDATVEDHSGVLVAEAHFLSATVTVADDQEFAAPELTARFVPDAIPFAPGAEDAVLLIVHGPLEDLEKVAEGRLQPADESGDAGSSLPEVAVLESVELGTDPGLSVAFSLVSAGEDAPFLEASVAQLALVELVGSTPGTYDLALTLAFDDDEVATASDASVVILVKLTVEDEAAGEEPADDGISAELQPAAWNTNWLRVGAGWVTVKISGTGYADIDLDAIALSLHASMPEPEDQGPDDEALKVIGHGAEADGETLTVLLRERAQRQGNHVRAFFRQLDAISLLGEPIPGNTYDLWVLIGDGAALLVTVKVTGPPH